MNAIQLLKISKIKGLLSVFNPHNLKKLIFLLSSNFDIKSAKSIYISDQDLDG